MSQEKIPKTTAQVSEGVKEVEEKERANWT